MASTIVLAGCGNIGRRHLQALGGIGRPFEIILVDPVEASREAALTALAPFASHVTARAAAGWESLPATVDLAIVATSAGPRRAVVEALLGATTPGFLLLEKVLFTTARDLDACGALLDARGVPAAVNCGRRGFPDYERLRDALAGRAGLSMAVSGSDWNLCSNGIHFIDLCHHLTGLDPLSLSEAGLAAAPVPSRHPGCIEFHGTLAGPLPGGGTLSLTSLPEPGVPITVEIAHGAERWIVEEGGRRLTHRAADGSETVGPFETLMVSAMGFLYTEMLDERVSRLPSYAVSARHHRLFIDPVRRRLGLDLSEDPPCPIS